MTVTSLGISEGPMNDSADHQLKSVHTSESADGMAHGLSSAASVLHVWTDLPVRGPYSSQPLQRLSPATDRGDKMTNLPRDGT